MTEITVLMYHALSKTGVFEQSQMVAADRSYALQSNIFLQHLQLLKELKIPTTLPISLLTGPAEIEVASAGFPADNEGVIITFDDSWESHLTVAKPLLNKFKMQAIFFLTVQQIGHENMLSWEQVKELSKKGFHIGSHGMRHRYFNQLSDAELKAELADSKKALADAIGKEIYLLSLPGGRGHKNLATIAEESGYTHIFSSAPGLWQGEKISIPRLALKPVMQYSVFAQIMKNPARYCYWKRLRYRLLEVLRLILGNRGYDKLRNLMLREDK